MPATESAMATVSATARGQTIFNHHPSLLASVLGSVRCKGAHRGVGLGPAAAAGEMRRRTLRRATMHAATHVRVR
jgi:hypothetical protein